MHESLSYIFGKICATVIKLTEDEKHEPKILTKYLKNKQILGPDMEQWITNCLYEENISVNVKLDYTLWTL